jgi:hypothetical protein
MPTPTKKSVYLATPVDIISELHNEETSGGNVLCMLKSLGNIYILFTVNQNVGRRD